MFTKQAKHFLSQITSPLPIVCVKGQ